MDRGSLAFTEAARVPIKKRNLISNHGFAKLPALSASKHTSQLKVAIGRFAVGVLNEMPPLIKKKSPLFLFKQLPYNNNNNNNLLTTLTNLILSIVEHNKTYFKPLIMITRN